MEAKKLNHLSDSELILSLQNKAKEERKITAELIALLQEVDYRKLYLIYGYGSLIEFCIKELKYSESSAYRRIAAMRITRELPCIEEKVINGTLSLSVLSQAQTQIKREEKEFGKVSLENKASLIRELENMSCRDAEKVLIARTPELLPKERVRVLTPEQSEVRLTFSQETLDKLEQIKSLTSHKSPNATYAELIDMMADIALQKLDPIKKASNQAKEKSRQAATPARSEVTPGAVRREVWRRAQGQCSYVGEKGRCSSRFQLQIDHKVPRYKGGSNCLNNLQLLCSQHNRLKGFS